MKRNELFRSLMNVQSQVTSLMNVVLQEGSLNPSNNVLLQEPGEGITLANGKKILTSDATYIKEKVNENIKKIKAYDPNKVGQDPAVTAAKRNPRFFEKIAIMLGKLHTIDGNINNEEFKKQCVTMGSISLGVGCIFGYILYPNLKADFIEAFNGGNPSFDRIVNLMKGVAKSTIAISFLAFGSLLLYHGLSAEGIDPSKHAVLGSVLNALLDIKNKVIEYLQNAALSADRSLNKPEGKMSWAW